MHLQCFQRASEVTAIIVLRKRKEVQTLMRRRSWRKHSGDKCFLFPPNKFPFLFSVVLKAHTLQTVLDVQMGQTLLCVASFCEYISEFM